MFRTLGFLGAAALLLACTTRPGSTADSAAGGVDTAAVPPSASIGSDPGLAVTMRDIAGRDLGTLMITETPAGLSVAGTLRGLPPGPHAIHVHMTGACAAPFESAGDHWNPTNRQHGRQNPQGPHVGDLAGIVVRPDSSVLVGASTPGGTLRGVNPLLDADGAAIVIHADRDDEKTDPSGNSGSRIACGAIAVS